MTATVDRPMTNPPAGSTESLDPWRYTWDGSAEGWPDVALARDRIVMGPPKVD